MNAWQISRPQAWNRKTSPLPVPNHYGLCSSFARAQGIRVYFVRNAAGGSSFFPHAASPGRLLSYPMLSSSSSSSIPSLVLTSSVHGPLVLTRSPSRDCLVKVRVCLLLTTPPPDTRLHCCITRQSLQRPHRQHQDTSDTAPPHLKATKYEVEPREGFIRLAYLEGEHSWRVCQAPLGPRQP